MVLGKFVLVVLVLCVGMVSTRPSENEFNLFCRILAETERMITHVKDYIYDETKDREIVKEMELLDEATTDNMDDFRKMLWSLRDFLRAHPPPTDAKNRQAAHREIGQLIKEAERKFQESRELAVKINVEKDEAKLLVLQGLYGGAPTSLNLNGDEITEMRSNRTNIFGDVSNVTASCTDGEDKAGKTLFNDFFCVCVGEGVDQSHPPCHKALLPPKRGNKNCCKKDSCTQECCKDNKCCEQKKDCCNCKWTQMKYDSSGNDPLNLNESLEKIEKVCRDLLKENKQTNKVTTLLEEYMGLIEKGDDKVKKNKHEKKIFGHSRRKSDRGEVKECTGAGNTGNSGQTDYYNDKICVDYSATLKNGGQIPWHKKFREAAEKMDHAQQLEDQILKNRAALLLLKSQAWVAYSREKDDETSNLDDMNASDKKDTMAENKQGEPTNQEREYIDVPSQSTQGSQPSQPAPSNKDGRKYHYISSTEATQEEASAAPAGGGEPPYIYVSSTGTPSQPTPAPETPSPTQQDPPTQSAKRLRGENKTGE